MTKEVLKAMLDTPDVVIIDVRVGKGWSDSQLKIRVQCEKDPKRQNRGPINMIKTRPMFFTVGDAMRQQVPERHGSL